MDLKLHGLRATSAVAIALLTASLSLSMSAVRIASFAADGGTTTANLLVNGGFEEGPYAPEALPAPWVHQAFDSSAAFRWDDATSRTGARSVKIDAPLANDAGWSQTVAVQPGTVYLASVWVKTQDVAHTQGLVDAGVNVSLGGTWDRSLALYGTNDWTKIELLFNSGDRTSAEIALRIGFWSGTTSGTVWFDDAQLVPVQPSTAHPGWKILVLIYEQTDAVLDGHHVVATMSQAERDLAAANATTFVTTDIPALSSQNMVPTVQVRYPEHPLSRLSAIGGGWWPSPDDVMADRDRSFDSVIVIWDPRVTDLTTGQERWIGFSAGLTQDTATSQTYASMIIEAATQYGHRNVFKHEFGHSILMFYRALGVVPLPDVTNEPPNGSYYVHCPTGGAYVWQDETDSAPIPNSIYNNASGFTHDYYSGTTALATSPTQCLGITPQSWAYGGPASHSTPDAPTSPCTITGTAAADVLVGTEGPDVICGLGGNDRIYAKGGSDRIHGGDGDDLVYGGSGRDVVLGGAGRDSLVGGPGTDQISGGTGNDALLAKDAARDIVDGGSGWDRATIDRGLDNVTSVESLH